MLQDYLIFDRATDTIIGLQQLHPEQVPYNTNGGAWDAIELDGKFRTVEMVDGMPVQRFNLDLLRAPLIRRVEAEATALRGKIVGDPTMAATYAAKVEEAKASRGPRPFLDAEAKATGVDIKDLIAAVLAKDEAAKPALIAIEAKRRAAVVQLKAEDATVITMIYAAMVEWPEV